MQKGKKQCCQPFRSRSQLCLRSWLEYSKIWMGYLPIIALLQAKILASLKIMSDMLTKSVSARIVSGRKRLKKRPVTTLNHSICILSCCVRSENSIKQPGHYMEKWKSRWHTAIVILHTDSSLRPEWQNKDISTTIDMTSVNWYITS